jgi:5S rRNA maturation endonuclease (ribonuclease M5)
LKTKPVIVEGRKDKNVLLKLGFKKIITLNKKGLYESVSHLEEERVVILTDFDKKGEQLAKKLELFLRKNDSVARKNLRKLFLKNQIHTIEGLKKIIERRDAYGEVGTGYRKIHDIRKIRSRRLRRKT